MKLNISQLVILVSAFVGMLIPLNAMLFTKEVNWSIYDFAIAGILFLSTAFLCEFIFRKIKIKWLKISLISLVILITIVFWIELAVGLFNSPFAGS